MSRKLAYTLTLLLSGGACVGLVGYTAFGLKPERGGTGDQERPQVRSSSGVSSPDRSDPTPHLIRKLTDPALHQQDQIEAVRALPSDLTEGEYAALMGLLRRPAPSKVNPGSWYVLLNEVMEVLRDSRFQWEGYSEAMSALVTDRHVDPVIRDYASQHLAQYLSDRGEVLSKEKLESGMEAFLTVLLGERESFQPVAGTTLMALCDLNENRAEMVQPYRDKLEEVVLGYVTGESPSSLSNQIAGIQTAGRMGFEKALPVIRAYALDEASRPSIRLSSVAALGYFAEPSDQDFLRQLSESGGRLRFAAREALKKYDRQ